MGVQDGARAARADDLEVQQRVGRWAAGISDDHLAAIVDLENAILVQLAFVRHARRDGKTQRTRVYDSAEVAARAQYPAAGVEMTANRDHVAGTSGQRAHVRLATDPSSR